MEIPTSVRTCVELLKSCCPCLPPPFCIFSPTMPLIAAVTFLYRHPGRKTAVLRGYVADIPAVVQTHCGEEQSLGPVEFFTDFGGWFSGAKQHGGWNVTAEGFWFAFNCRGAEYKIWKISFRTQDAGRGTFIGDHPYQDGVQVVADLESVTRWRMHVPRSWRIGEQVRVIRSTDGQPDAGLIPAKEGDEFTVLYVGEKDGEEPWVYVERDAQQGWIEKSFFEGGAWEAQSTDQNLLTGLQSLAISS